MYNVKHAGMIWGLLKEKHTRPNYWTKFYKQEYFLLVIKKKCRFSSHLEFPGALRQPFQNSWLLACVQVYASQLIPQQWTLFLARLFSASRHFSLSSPLPMVRYWEPLHTFHLPLHFLDLSPIKVPPLDLPRIYSYGLKVECSKSACPMQLLMFKSHVRPWYAIYSWS